MLTIVRMFPTVIALAVVWAIIHIAGAIVAGLDTIGGVL